MFKILLLGLILVLLWYFWFTSKKPKIVHQATQTEEAAKNMLQTITELSSQNEQLAKGNQQLLTRLRESQGWGILKTAEPEEPNRELESLKRRINKKKKPK